MFVADTGVRNLFHAGLGNLAADGVGLLAVTNFLFHAGACHGSHFSAGNPATAGDCAEGLFAFHVAAALFVDAAAVERIPFPRSGIADRFVQHRTWNLLRFCNPVTSANRNFLRFANRFADCVADVSVAGLDFGPIGCAANFAIFRFADRFADRAADIAIAGLEARLANRAADIFIVCLNAGLADGATDIFVAGLEAGFANRAADVFVAGLIDWLADGVALITVAGFMNVACACDRNLFRAGLVHGAASIHGALFVDGLPDSLVAHSAESPGGAEIPAGIASIASATFVTGRPAVRGFDFGVGSECQYARYDDPGCVSHQSVP